ncbi:MAG: hypothetical protein J6C10_00760 [Prevotella sp.]|nr:hypothetical protein [Prevotella sp.]
MIPPLHCSCCSYHHDIEVLAWCACSLCHGARTRVCVLFTDIMHTWIAE